MQVSASVSSPHAAEPGGLEGVIAETLDHFLERHAELKGGGEELAVSFKHAGGEGADLSQASENFPAGAVRIDAYRQVARQLAAYGEFYGLAQTAAGQLRWRGLDASAMISSMASDPAFTSCSQTWLALNMRVSGVSTT